jgi:hypothetical protein
VDLIPEGRGGLRALLASLLTNPIFVLKHVFTEPKILFFLKLFGPLLCLPFLAHRGKVMMLYGFAFLNHQLGGFIGLMLAGFLRESTGSYDIVWWLSIALGVASALINLPISEKPVARAAPAAAA